MKHSGCFAIPTAIILFAAPTLATSRPVRVMLAQAAPPEICTEVYQPVCATDAAGKRITYPNACYARRAQATKITRGQCPR